MITVLEDADRRLMLAIGVSLVCAWLMLMALHNDLARLERDLIALKQRRLFRVYVQAKETPPDDA